MDARQPRADFALGGAQGLDVMARLDVPLLDTVGRGAFCGVRSRSDLEWGGGILRRGGRY